jgi:HEAT repeat protein
MGLLDAMFGGGTKLELMLDTPQASAGGVVGGRVVLHGGKKPLKLTELQVKLLYVAVTSRDDSPLPDIDTRILLTQTIAAGADLPPESQSTFTFRFTVPDGTELSAHNVSYKVLASADIPGVKDPGADLELKVIEPSSDAHRRLPVEEVFARFPGLRSGSEEELCEGLRELFLACYAEGGQFMEVEPHIAAHMQNGTVKVRRAALEAWANLVDNRVRPEHLQALYNVANTPGLDQETFDEVIIAACKFAEEGALNLVQQLAQSASGHVRKQIASNLRFNAAEKFEGKRELLITLAQDPDPTVRAAAVGAMACYRDDAQLMHGVAHQIDNDAAPAVQAAGIATLCLVHHHGMVELQLAVYQKHLANPHPEVRKEIADSVNWLPKAEVQRIWPIVEQLLADQDEDVRRAMAFQFHNMEKLPQLLPLIQRAAQNDPSPRVRREALGSMAALMTPEQIVPYYEQILGQDSSVDTMWAVLNGLREHREHPLSKRLLTQLTQAPHAGLADAAREELTRR